MDVETAIMKRRAIRRFNQKPVPIDVLKKLVDAARLAPSGANLQPLQYIVVNDSDLLAKIFSTLSWAGYLKPAWRPAENERPTAYIVILTNEKLSPYCEIDVGLAAENIMLMAVSTGLGSCMIRKMDKDKLRQILKVPDRFDINTIIALGYPSEEPILEEMKDSVEYWRDEKGNLHVPKRKLEDILHINGY